MRGLVRDAERTNLPSLLVEFRHLARHGLDLLQRRAGAKQHLLTLDRLDATEHTVRVLGGAYVLALCLKVVQIHRAFALHVPSQTERRAIVSWHPSSTPNLDAVRSDADHPEANARARVPVAGRVARAAAGVRAPRTLPRRP